MQKHSRLAPAGRAFWWTERLWQLVTDLPEIEVTIDSITEFEADGGLMDGGHRVAKAWLEGRATVKAQRFEQDPTPDWIEPAEASGARI